MTRKTENAVDRAIPPALVAQLRTAAEENIVRLAMFCAITWRDISARKAAVDDNDAAFASGSRRPHDADPARQCAAR
jgi:hypothetical protein